MLFPKVSIVRLPAPYSSKCFDDWGQTSYGDYVPRHPEDPDTVLTGWHYTLPLCQRVCLLSHFDQTCNCTHPRSNMI